MVDPRPLAREELARFLPNQRAIRAFEKLFDLIPDDLVKLLRLVNEANITAGTALAIAQQSAKSNHQKLDYIDFNGMSPRAAAPRRLAWSSGNDTLAVHHRDGTTQRVGEEQYIRFTNDTGVTITTGDMLGLENIGGAIVGVVTPYIADGTKPPLNALGIATGNIEPGEEGRLTTLGMVRGVDTTGQNGEVWGVGEVLYASPNIAGGLTNQQPITPDWSIPVALITTLDAAEGELFVRIVIEQELYYGAFAKTTSHTPAAVDTAYPITFDAEYEANGVKLETPTPNSRVIVDSSGLYDVSASFQLTSTNASQKDIRIWFRVNGIDRDFSTIITTLSGNGETITQTRSIFFLLEAGDYIECVWASTDINSELTARTATAYSPSAPAVLLTIEQMHR